MILTMLIQAGSFAALDYSCDLFHTAVRLAVDEDYSWRLAEDAVLSRYYFWLYQALEGQYWALVGCGHLAGGSPAPVGAGSRPAAESVWMM